MAYNMDRLNDYMGLRIYGPYMDHIMDHIIDYILTI